MPSQDIESRSEFDNLALYTGNVMKTSIGGRNSVFHKKSNIEILAAIDDTLDYGFSNNQLSYRYHTKTKLLEVPDFRLSSRIEPGDRNDVEVTAKLFYLDHDSSQKETYAQEALDHLHKLLDVNSIDTLIISDNKLPPSFGVWKSLENLVNSGKVQKLGVTDLSRDDLEGFLNNGQVQVKPVINQVHVRECFNMPRDLIQLGKEKGIELLHNGDCTTILAKDELTCLLKRYGLLQDQNTAFQPCWVLKYNIFIVSRNVVTDKGYIVVASKTFQQ